VSQTARPSYTLTKAWLALDHRLPWSLMNFSRMFISEVFSAR